MQYKYKVSDLEYCQSTTGISSIKKKKNHFKVWKNLQEVCLQHELKKSVLYICDKNFKITLTTNYVFCNILLFSNYQTRCF